MAGIEQALICGGISQVSLPTEGSRERLISLLLPLSDE